MFSSTRSVAGRPRRPRAIRTSALLVAAAAVIGLALAGCSSAQPTPTSSSAPAAKQVLRFGFSAEPPKLSTTGGTASTVSYQLFGLVHRGVMAWDSKGNVAPGLAQSVKQTDPLTYDFTLRKGLKFQDGTPVTSENVKASLLHYADPANSARSYAGMKYIKSIDTESDTRFTIHLTGVNSSFLEYLADPTAVVVPDNELLPGAQATIGAGPFSLAGWDDGVGLTLKKFGGYYGASKVTLSEIDVSFYADGNARVNALLSGDVDMVDYVPWENFDQINGSSGYSVKGATGVFQSALFNVVDGPFKDKRLRQAVAYAINRDNSIKAAFFGNADPLYGVPGTGKAGEKLWSYDPAKAKKLLAEAGYKKGELTIHLLTNSTYTFLQDLSLSVQSDLEAIGIKVDVTSPDWATFTQQAVAGQYDLIVQGNIGNVKDPAAWLPGLVSSPPAAANRSFGYDNPKLDSALSDALSASSKGEKAKDMATAYSIIKEDVPFASINQRMQAYALSDRVKGFTVMPGFTQPYSVNNLIDVSMAGK